jgi:hypothetical protein
MKNISTGFGLCVLGLGIAAWPVLDRLAPTANASAVSAAASAVSTAVTGQTGPTVVWYDATSYNWSIGYQQYVLTAVQRAWSDGRVEMKLVRKQLYFHSGSGSGVDESCASSGVCTSPWFVISDPAQGLTYRSDINFDAKVDGADLGQLLADWGDAPRQDIPPSDCPLALINP